MSRLAAAARVAVALPLSTAWQAAAGRDLAADRAALLQRATGALEALGAQAPQVVEASVVASEEDGRAAASRAREQDAEVVLVLATMATLASLPLAALDALDDLPVVVWALAQGDPLDGADHQRIVLDGGTVGGPVLTSMLVRAGRPFALVLGALGDAETLARTARALRAGAAARRIARARLGRIGTPTPGYGCVELDLERLRYDVGPTVVQIEPRELAEAYAAVPGADVAAVLEETCAAYAPDASLSREELARAARAGAALEALTRAHDLDGGALTCHVEGIRFEPGLGFAPCFALGRMTSRGTPWCCSTDLPAAVAMLTLKALGGAAQYHELEALDTERGEFLIASSGEHDLAFAGEQPRLVRNGWFPTDAHASVCACFAAPAGPATLLGFAQLDAPAPAHRLVVASGAFAAPGDAAGVGTPHASFRFAGGEPTAAWEAWCAAGVGLHTACTPGGLADALALVGRFLGIDVVHV